VECVSGAIMPLKLTTGLIGLVVIPLRAGVERSVDSSIHDSPGTIATALIRPTGTPSRLLISRPKK
jgi:hypothetical protein